MKNYSKLGLFKSKGRLFSEPLNKYRSPFQRDRDRIIHSASFRRLKHKTQVFVNTDGDHYRTRITHSLEVAQIARSITRYLNLNDDLAETLSLAHDLGHTPFGHAGEDALNECMTNYGGFDHNLQTLRIIMFLEHKYIKFKGLNLTVETLDGLLKHNGPYYELSKLDKLIGLKNLKGKINFTTYPSLEAQIAAMSDDIAYNNHDIQDGIKAKLFSLKELIARIKAVLRRTYGDSDELVFGDIKFDLVSHQVFIKNKKVHIGRREYRLLRFLMQNNGKVYSRAQLLDHVWGQGNFFQERTVDVHIRRLRSLLENHKLGNLIQTVRGTGYGFNL